MGNYYLAHVGNQFQATAVASEKDKNVPYHKPSDIVQFFFHGNILNKQTQKKQFAYPYIIKN